MKRFLRVGIATIALCLTAKASAQDVRVSNVLGKHFPAQGRVIELDLPEEMDGAWFIVGWIKADGQQVGMRRVGRGGRHCYDMRQNPDWQGQVQAVAISLTGVRGRVKEPALLDEIDMFREPEWITPSAVNVLTGHALFSWSWEVILLLVSGLVAVFFRWKKKPMALCAVLGFGVAWGLMDLRHAYDRGVVLCKAEKYRLAMPPLTEAKVFADRASEVIGGETWSPGTLRGVSGNFIKYRLAEQPCAPPGAGPPARYLVTQTPEGGAVLLQHANYFLIRKDRP
jgi:hypothetical protein